MRRSINHKGKYDEAAGKSPQTDSEKTSRDIPAKLRDKVFTRDGGRCTYVDPGGRRCSSTWDLQVDHIKPHARGGPNTLENLRRLCGDHNRLEAERLMGEAHMAKYYRRE